MANQRRTARRIVQLFPATWSNLKPALEAVAQTEARLASRWASAAYRRLMAVEWAIPPQPEHFDHRIDLYYLWLARRSSFWVERGVFGSLALKGADVLELACGDGFNARNFYSLRSRRIVACDFDQRAILTATGFNQAPNIEYVVADIRTEMPDGVFDNVVWDAAIEHFAPDEIDSIMRSIKERLTSDGILSGYTIVERADHLKSLSHHEYEFTSKEDLLRFLSPHFENVTVFETIHPDRHNLYFWASDAVVPFGAGWPAAVYSTSGVDPATTST
jgi:SAM-dependent methyltransferase